MPPWDQSGRQEGEKVGGGSSVPQPIYCTRLIFPEKVSALNSRDVAVGVDDVHVGGDGDVDGSAACHACVPVGTRV